MKAIHGRKAATLLGPLIATLALLAGSAEGVAGTEDPIPLPHPTQAPNPAPDFVKHVASPGDTVVYAVKFQDRELTMTYKSVEYSMTDKRWSVLISTQGSEANLSLGHYESLWSTDDAQYILEHCEENLGTLETIAVAAGRSFKACKIDNGQANIWYGNVPVFGIVKIDYYDGSDYSAELSSFSWGDSQ